MSTSTPEWLVKAEEAERERRALEEQQQRAQAAAHAKVVNAHLADLGITPVQPAFADYWLRPALLAHGDVEEEAYTVWAGYRSDLGVVLLVGEERHKTEYAGELHTVADVARARYEGPITEPQPPWSWRVVAEKEARSSTGYLSTEVAAVCDGLRGITAALLSQQRPPVAEVPSGTEVDLDCEFLPGDLSEHGLVSLGLTAGPGRSLYVVNADMDVAAVLRVPFMREHVWPHLPLTADGALDRRHPDVHNYAAIRTKVTEFFDQLADDVTLWVYCGAQDVVRLHTLWGNNWANMPASIPTWADDLARLRQRAGGAKLPPHTRRQHHALDDAIHQRQARAHLRSLSA